MVKLRSKLVAIAVIIGGLPAVNIVWEVARVGWPLGWWWITRVAGWPAFTVLEKLVFYDWWVPTNVTHMTFAEHILRWLIFVATNVMLWVLAALAVDYLLQRWRHRRSGTAG